MSGRNVGDRGECARYRNGDIPMRRCESDFGLLTWDWIEDRLVITYVPGAQGQPIAAGDTVLSIDGKPVVKALAEAEALRSGATPQWIRYRALGELGVARPASGHRDRIVPRSRGPSPGNPQE